MATPMSLTNLFPATGRFRRTILVPLSQLRGGGIAESFIYDGQNAGFSSYAEELNGQNASFSSWSRTIFPPLGDGTYPNVEA